ncbi:hypothetical protein CO033_00585 [Candidatus Nomurabacteria bacterium CG_4_9_14_0_2_um_filter_32_10]|uniref:Uncharacterized protein n=3 Tax=Candidatus Nomuraibacteriota TaxID=1752729 RepID=A0A2H0CG44_9BACT|nr:MAG: hypothetical protein COW91_02510 [Candidatus Nomurabacteria bacterium CG22_combo_CG10-13_8_21_14_all_32_8]PIZ85764.1 MAG: hypothetical protein COX94_02045 [Candidatus Nomurabacteria bacterium CG_4_10_14_0_2_um_filter_33_9]PJC49618.1 MAG: hypothetical protein CO033_00585 [Candidatus Nomurabacteria bacterium CG_4_9_14_0_2_um_filter_32_10]
MIENFPQIKKEKTATPPNTPEEKEKIENNINTDADKNKTDSKDTLKSEKKNFKAVLVDTTDVMREQARDVADASMTMELPKNPDDLKGFKKVFKGEFWKRAGEKIWKHGLWRDYYRNKEINRAREEILKSGNMFAAEGREKASHDQFVADVIDQFSSEYEEAIHTEAGEKRLREGEVPKEKETKDQIKKFIKEYANGNITKEAFIEQEKRIFHTLKEDINQEKTGKGGQNSEMYASNLFGVAEQVKLAMAHGEFLKDEDFDLEIIYGKSKAGVRTEAKFNKAEKWAEKLSHTKIGQFVNETTVATALSIVSSLSQRGLTSLAGGVAKIVPFLGTALVSSGVAGIRETKKFQEERRQHSREMAKGKVFDLATMERRKEMEQYRYQTENATQIISNIQQNREALIQNSSNLSPAILKAMLDGFSSIEARIRLSDRTNIDLISYSDTTKVVEERKNLDIERAKIKTEFKKLFDAGKFTASNGQDFKTYLNSLATTQENILMNEKDTGIDAKDRIFNEMKKKRFWQAAGKGFVSGLIIGTTMQEVMAATGADTILGGSGHTSVFGDTKAGGQLTALASLKHLMEGQTPSMNAGNLHEVILGANHIKSPEGINLIQNPDGSYNLMNGNNIVSKHLMTNPDGTFTDQAENVLAHNGVKIDKHLIDATTQKIVNVDEYIKNHLDQTHEIHRGWYDNDTEIFDKNELRTQWGGENGTGIDQNGNYVLNVSHMTPSGSYHEGLSANAQELMKIGHLKMLFSMSEGTQNHVFEVIIGADGKIIIDPNSEIGKILFANNNGHAEFLGRFGEIGQDMGNNKFIMLSTIEGKGLKDIVDTIHSPTPETILNIPNGSNWDMPPFIPIMGRNPLEKGGLNEKTPDFVYYLNYYREENSEERLKLFEKMRSKTLKENHNAKLDHYKEVKDYLEKQNPEYLERIKNLANQTDKMGKDCKVSICIPVAGHQEGKNIYESLQNYTYQTAKPEEYELVLFVNHPEKDQKENLLNADETLKEIERFKKDYPNINTKIIYQALENKDAKIGKIRKLLTDATLVRQHERGENAPDLIIISNDADNKGISPDYVQSFINNFEKNPKVDGFLGQLDWDPESYQKYPAIHIGTRLFQFLNAIGRARTGSMTSSGANSAFRSSIYAGIGGYLENTGGEDVAIRQAIMAARDNDKNRWGFGGTGTRLFTSSRRSIDALKSGLAPIEQWNKGFSVFDDEIRKSTMKNKTEINYDDKKTQEELKKSLEDIINKTLDVYEAGEKQVGGKGNPSFYKKALNLLGIKYNLNRKGDVVILNMDPIIKNLKTYQIEGKLIRDAKSGKQEAIKLLKSIREEKKGKNKKEEKKENKTLNSKKLEKGIEILMERFPENKQGIELINRIISKGLDKDTLKKLGLENLKLKEIKKELEECKKISDKTEFMKKVINILKPLAFSMDEHPKEFAEFQRKAFNESLNLTPINEMLSYRVDEGDLHLHLAPATDISNITKIRLIKDALEKLPKIVDSNKKVKKISATSWIVASNPGLLEKVGFKNEGPISEETKKRDFAGETHPISRATITREEFLTKYLKSKNNFIKKLIKFWMGKLKK